MACYSRLPAEIRQHILGLALIGSNEHDQLDIAGFHGLAIINKQSFADMKVVASKWSPVYPITSPEFVSRLAAIGRTSFCILPQPTVIRLDLFHSADLIHIQNSPTWDSDSLCERWKEKLVRLPAKRIKTVLIDVTPAPGWFRTKPLVWTAALVNDGRVGRQFVPWHAPWIVEMCQQISAACKRRVDIILIGYHSQKSAEWVSYIVEKCRTNGIVLRDKVEYVAKPPTEIQTKPLTLAVRKLYGQQHQHRNFWEFDAKRQLQRYWRQSTEDTYAACIQIDKVWPEYVLDSLFYFLSQYNLDMLELQPGNTLQRKLVHRMAGELGLYTETFIQDERKRVRVSRHMLNNPQQASSSGNGAT